MSHTPPPVEINPATGLPMTGGVDIHGNPFGTNINSHDNWSSGINDDRYRSSGSGFDN